MVWGTHFIPVSVVGSQKHSTERVCLLPGECWAPPELLTSVTVFIRFCVSSLVSQVTLTRARRPPASDLDADSRRLLGCALMAHSLRGGLVMNLSNERGKYFLSTFVAISQMVCFDFLLIYYPELYTRQILGISAQADFYFTVSPKENSTVTD